MSTAWLPYRQIEYQTSLTADQIGQRLSENIITGFSFYSQKPYYDDFTPYSFSVRETSSNFKKQGLGPRVEGTYKIGDGQMRVTLSLRSHTVWIVALCLFSCPIVRFMVGSIPTFIKTGDLTILLNILFPALALYGIFWLVFQGQSKAGSQFRKHTLQLQEIRL